MRLAITLAAIAIAIAGPLYAQTNVAGTETPAARDSANRLAALVVPREAIIAIRVPRFDALYADQLKSDATLAALEKTHPGVTEAVVDVVHDEAGKAYGEVVTKVQADVATLYGSRFTDAELAKLIAFFSTQTGQAMITLSASGSGDTVGEFEADRRRKALARLEHPDDQAKADLTMLIQSGLLPKVKAITPEISSISARHFDEVSKIIEAAAPRRNEATVASYTKKPQP